MASISHIHQEAAQRIRSDLLNALGTENIPNQWMHFMATVRQHLPEVLSRGRPTKRAIDDSVVGALGFTSWRSLLETPTDAGGLGLTWSTWRQWSRAWATVQQHPGLENAPLTAAEINRVHSDARAANEPMPADMAAVETFWEQQKGRKEAARANTLAAMRELIETMEASLAANQKDLTSAYETMAELRHQFDYACKQKLRAEHRLVTEQQQHSEAQAKLAKQLQQVEKQKQALESDLQAYQSRGFWQRLRDLFAPR